MTSQSQTYNRFLMEGKTITAKKKVFHLKSISSNIFQAIFLKLLQSNLYTTTKKKLFGTLKNFE